MVRVSRRVRDGRAALLPHPAAACCVSKAGDHSPATFRSASAAQSGRARRDLRLPAADHRRSTVLATTASASPTTISHPFHPLSKVLFIFPSRYLFAIGLLPIFSLRCDLPPALGCIPKQPDSSAAGRQLVSLRHGALTLSGAAFQQTHTATPISPARLHSTTPIAGFPKLSSSRFTRRYWGNHCYFLLLRLLICLSSAGRLACLRPDWSLSRVLPHDNRGAFHRAARPARQYYYYCFRPSTTHTSRYTLRSNTKCLTHASHTAFRTLLRSSSLQEPRDPLLRVSYFADCHTTTRKLGQARPQSPPSPPSPPLILPQVHLRKPCYDFYFL